MGKSTVLIFGIPVCLTYPLFFFCGGKSVQWANAIISAASSLIIVGTSAAVFGWVSVMTGIPSHFPYYSRVPGPDWLWLLLEALPLFSLWHVWPSSISFWLYWDLRPRKALEGVKEGSCENENPALMWALCTASTRTDYTLSLSSPRWLYDVDNIPIFQMRNIRLREFWKFVCGQPTS